jgi:inner membrane protein
MATMTSNVSPSMVSALRSAQMLRILVLGLLVLVLKIPIAMIGGLVSERQTTREAAAEDVAAKWGRLQALTGPALVVPYTFRWVETGEKGQRIEHTAPRFATFLPEQLEIRGRVDAENRRRGIFSIPVYRLALEVSGHFARPSLAEWNVAPDDVDWNRAQLSVGVSDARGIQEQASLRWNGQSFEFLPGEGLSGRGQEGIHVALGDVVKAPELAFSFPLVLNGSKGAYFAPFGRTTKVDLVSNWGSPSFQGNWLPTSRSLGADGFESNWSISYLGRNYPQAWNSETNASEAIERSQFGVDLIDPVDEHRMAERSVKYATLFMLLTFASIWLTEIRTRIRVHPIQYLLVGAALCLFYLLELSLSEHLGFSAAYAIASIAVVIMVGAYSLAVLRGPRRALAVGGTTALLYAYLFVLLTNEDYSLLAGSLGLFLILATIMFLTRRIDWYDPSA